MVRAVDFGSARSGPRVRRSKRPVFDGILCLTHSTSASLVAGWMTKVKLSDVSELDDLMDAAAYEAFCAE